MKVNKYNIEKKKHNFVDNWSCLFFCFQIPQQNMLSSIKPLPDYRNPMRPLDQVTCFKVCLNYIQNDSLDRNEI